MQSYTLGPLLALLPKRWRESLPLAAAVQWRPAVILSGAMESALALTALVYWYSYSVTHWAAEAVYSAIRNGAEIDPRTIGFAGLAVTCLHPLTWLIAYFGVEGMVRLCAAITDTTLGVLPLFLADRAYQKLVHPRNLITADPAKFSETHLASGIRAVREMTRMAMLAPVPDELRFLTDGAAEVMEIRSCRAKPGWTPPRVVRHEDRYYRLEAYSEGGAARPFIYTLRRLSVGVPGRTVLIYSPDQTPVLRDR